MRGVSIVVWLGALGLLGAGCGGSSDPDDRLDAGRDAGSVSSDAGTVDRDSGAPPDGGPPPDGGVDGGMLSCELGEACCPDGTCSDGSSCAGEVCSCIRAMHGDHYVRSDGTVLHRGSSSVIEIGDTGEVLDDMTEVFEGHFNACGRRMDGTAWCWPKAASFPALGQNGDGTLSGSGTRWQANQVLTAAETPLTGVVHLQSGESTCYLASTYCAILDDGTLWCWGEGGNGGGGSIHTDGGLRKAYATQAMADETTPLTDVEQVSLGRRHACALVDGSAFCWGANVGGALGQGNQTARQYPTEVVLPGTPAPTVTKVAASSDFSCAVTDAGRVFCWGLSGSGAVGLGDPMETTDGCINYCRLTPAEVIDTTDTVLDEVVDIHLAYQASCAIRTDTSLWCWGSGVGDRATPLLVADEPVENVSLITMCGTGTLPGSLRYLTRDDVLHTPSVTAQMCP